MTEKPKRRNIVRNVALLLAAAVVAGAAVGTAVFADRIPNIVVDGATITTDVQPQIVQGRVMVPISFIARALGAKVGWDNRTKTVSIVSGPTPTTDVWEQQLSDLYARRYMLARNVVLTFLMKHDTRDPSGKNLVTEDYDSDVTGFTPDVIVPIGGIYPSFIDHEVVDATYSDADDEWTIRMKVYQWVQGMPDLKIQVLTLDFHVVGTTNLIKGVWSAGTPETVDAHTVFPGLTLRR